jgi:hypothetical protein
MEKVVAALLKDAGEVREESFEDLLYVVFLPTVDQVEN